MNAALAKFPAECPATFPAAASTAKAVANKVAGRSPARASARSAAGGENDEALLASIARGDEGAMRHLFGRYRVSVYRFVRRILRRDDLVDDVVADVFFEVWKRAGAFEGRSTVITWILGIARFKALSALRQRSYAALDDATIENTVDPADDPAAAFERDDTASALRSAIAALAPLHAEVVDLIYYHGRTLGEVAEILGIPENTVKTRVFAARKKLAEMLAARGIDRL